MTTSRKTLLDYVDVTRGEEPSASTNCEREGIQDRVLLTLEEHSRYELAKSAVSSSLKLAHNLVCLAFHDFDKLLQLKQSLDSIKMLAVGLRSAESKASGYSVANYSVYLFAFQQYFHSAYRALQGKVLENVLTQFIAKNFKNIRTTKTKIKYDELFEKLVGKKLERGEIRYDLDLVLTKEDGFIVIQIRSRDDTGGTTAKRSLSAPLRHILSRSEGQRLRYNLDYIIYVWEPLDYSQKGALVRNTLSELGFDLREENTRELEEKLLRGSREQLSSQVTLQIVYGSDELIDALCLHEDCDDVERLKDILRDNIDKLGRWDDLWLTYAIVSLELESYLLRGTSNIFILEKMLESLGIKFSPKDLANYRCSSIAYAQRIMANWKEATLPVNSPSDQFNYIRDLVLLRMMYQKIRGACSRILKDIKPLKLASS